MQEEFLDANFIVDRKVLAYQSMVAKTTTTGNY